MGLSKALMEKLMIAKSLATATRTVFCGVRYGNVMYSRGSVIPLFVDQINAGKSLTVTVPNMTRFLLSLPNAVDLVLYALAHGEQGDIFVRKSPASTVIDLARACLNIFGSKQEVIEIGIREGEKLHETLVSWEELVRAESMDEYFRVSPESVEYDEYFSKGHRDGIPKESYTSENTKRLTISEIEELLLSLSEIQNEMHGLRALSHSITVT
jgi:UDP-glucose 4-epimerase